MEIDLSYFDAHPLVAIVGMVFVAWLCTEPWRWL